jgi:hypothetical protein
VDQRWLPRIVRQARDKAGIADVTFNDLRGTAVTRLALEGCTEAQIVSITRPQPQRRAARSSMRITCTAILNWRARRSTSWNWATPSARRPDVPRRETKTEQKSQNDRQNGQPSLSLKTRKI